MIKIGEIEIFSNKTYEENQLTIFGNAGQIESRSFCTFVILNVEFFL